MGIYGQRSRGVASFVRGSEYAYGKGIGKAIMAEAERIVKEQGYQSIRLDTYSKNAPAINFYESLGYKRRGDVFFKRGLFHCFEKSLVENE